MGLSSGILTLPGAQVVHMETQTVKGGREELGECAERLHVQKGTGCQSSCPTGGASQSLS